MKNSFKLGLVALMVAVTFASCFDNNKAKNNNPDSAAAKVDTAKKDSAKVDTAKKDTAKAKKDTAKKK